MPINVPPPVPQPNPGTPVPNEEDPIIVPPGPGAPIEIDDPPPEPLFPVREPGTYSPPQLARIFNSCKPAPGLETYGKRCYSAGAGVACWR